MKIKEGFILREVAGQYIVVPFGDRAVDFNGIINLNETAKFLWELSVKEINTESLVTALIGEYEIDNITAENAVNNFIQQMKEADLVE